MMVRDIIATIRDLEYQSQQFDALTRRVRHHNERCVAVSPDGVLRIAGDFVDLSRNELIRSLNQQSVEFRHPQPVSLTPGALGVRCEE